MAKDAGNGLEALAAAIAAQLARGLAGLGPVAGPTGEPSPRLPEIDPRAPEWPDLLPRPRLALQGLEITQSVQHYRTSYGPDNSIPMIALKPLVVRAYPFVQPGLLSPDTLSGETVTGELVLSRWNQEVYRTGPTRAGARIGAERDLDRTLWDEERTLFHFGGPVSVEGVALRWNPSLNFFVPAWYLRSGPMVATVRVWLTSGLGRPAVASQAFQVIDVEAPKIALVRVSWTDSAGNVFKPSDIDLLSLTNLASRMLPFPYFEAVILGGEEKRSGNFSGPPASPGGCNAAWAKLLTSLKLTRLFVRLFQLADIVYGVVPANAALTTGPANTGCGWSEDGVGACFVGDELAFCHEAGHLYGCGHIGDPALASYDPAYPNYGGSPTSTGEVGIDTALAGNPLRDPAGHHDLMSYSGPQWISPYTYQKILAARGKYMSVRADPRRVRPVLFLVFQAQRLVDGGRAVAINVSHLLEGAGHVGGGSVAGRSSWSIDLIDSSDRIVATHHCRSPVSLGSGCCCGGGAEVDEDREPYFDFVEAIEWPEGVARLAFQRRGETVATIEAGEPPEVEIIGPERREDGLAVTVCARHPRQSPSTSLLFSGDDGATWVPVATDLPADEPIVIDTGRLPGGPSCRFRVVATAELRSAAAETTRFDLPVEGRKLAIRAECVPCERGRVELSALIDSRGHGGLDPRSVAWRSDREGELGYGFTLSVRLSDGIHAIAASIPDGVGGTRSATCSVTVGEA